MENCCKDRPNFGRPACLKDWGTITSVILVPMKAANGSPYYWDLDFTYDDFFPSFFAQEPADRIYAFPQMENVEYAVADSLKEDGASGRKSFLRPGTITITGETWDGDATAVIKGKMAKLRCSDWGIYFVTDRNLIIGSKIRITTLLGPKFVFAPIRIDSQSVDPKFMFKTNTTTQKVMLTFDLDRNFKDETYYAISGDEMWSEEFLSVQTIDFNDAPSVIDCELVATVPTTTTVRVTVNDDYRQGLRNENNADPGNVVDLAAGNFILKNLSDGTTITPSAVVEVEPGSYNFTYAAQTSGERMQVSLRLDSGDQIHYSGLVEYVIP